MHILLGRGARPFIVVVVVVVAFVHLNEWTRRLIIVVVGAIDWR
jgi:hypothetical protein